MTKKQRAKIKKALKAKRRSKQVKKENKVYQNNTSGVGPANAGRTWRSSSYHPEQVYKRYESQYNSDE